VMEAADGALGVRLACEHRPDLILMNLSMPKMDGLSAAALLRADSRTTAIPIIACTGYIRDQGEDHAEDAGCNAYLEKPCEPSRLVEEVTKFIGPALAPRASEGRVSGTSA
jgi:two-component system, cell cycle response regulator DivK